MLRLKNKYDFQKNKKKVVLTKKSKNEVNLIIENKMVEKSDIYEKLKIAKKYQKRVPNSRN